MPSEAHAAIVAVWRIESARSIGGLVRIVHDIDRAQDLTAKNRAIDELEPIEIPSAQSVLLRAAALQRASRTHAVRQARSASPRLPQLQTLGPRTTPTDDD